MFDLREEYALHKFQLPGLFMIYPLTIVTAQPTIAANRGTWFNWPVGKMKAHEQPIIIHRSPGQYTLK